MFYASIVESAVGGVCHEGMDEEEVRLITHPAYPVEYTPDRNARQLLLFPLFIAIESLAESEDGIHEVTLVKAYGRITGVFQEGGQGLRIG